MSKRPVHDRMMTMSHGGLGIEHLVDVEPIGFDGRRDLFAATDLKLERRVAVRVLPALGDAEERSRFLDDARLLAAVSGHPNVVRVYDVGFTPTDRPYLVLELTSGPDLATWMEARGPLPWPRAIELTLQLAAGLAQVHRVGWLHRDLCPDNILLAGPNVKLSDVGILPSEATGTADPAVVVHRAPETLTGEWDERSDLYSLTSILHQMIDGHPAHWRPNDSIAALEHRITNQTAPALDPDMAPAALRVFVSAGLSPDPLDRPQDTAEFVRELELIGVGRTTGSTRSVLHASTTGQISALGGVGTLGVRPADDPTVVAWPPPGADQRTLHPDELPPPGDDDPAEVALTVAPAPATIPAPAPDPVWIDPLHRRADPLELPPPLESGDVVVTGGIIETDVPPRPAWTLGQDRSPLLLGAAAMAAIGLIGLVTIIALSLRGPGTADTEATPILPDPDTELAADGTNTDLGTGLGTDTDQASAQLAPVATPEESTTTTVSPEEVTTTQPPPVRATVPALVGTDIEVARQRLADAGFEVLVVSRDSPGSVPGTVVGQIPAGGFTVDLPQSVTLFIPRTATLPAMVGRPADTVCLQLEALGLRCEQTLQFDDQVPAGAVISTNPAEGTAFTPGSTVQLRVSRGKPVEAAVPPVAGMTEQEARAALSGAGFVTLTVTTTPSDNVPAGRAIGTEPAAGTRLGVDQSVTISMSSGQAPRVTMPDLVGQDRAAAEAALTSAKLKGTFVNRDVQPGDPTVGKVVASDPAAGTELAAGSTVTVTVATAAAPPGSTTSSTLADGG